MSCLRFLHSPGAGRFVLDETVTLVVGRDDSCGLILPDSRVSRQHASFDKREDGWWVRDLGSRNGITVNGDKTSQSRLSPGDVVGIGPVLVSFDHEPGAYTRTLDQDEITRALSAVWTMPESQRRLGLLLEIAAALDSIGSTDELLGRFRDLVVRLFEPCSCVLDLGGEKLTQHEECSGHAARESLRPLEDVLVGLRQRHEAILICDGEDAAESDGDRCLSAMGIPILIDGEALGFVYVDRRSRQHRTLNDEDLMLLIGVGRLISAAVAGSNRFARLDAENQFLRAQRGQAGIIIGESQPLKQLRHLIESRVGPVKSTVLLTGETGTGKSLAAEAIHLCSPRSKGPWVKINCAAIPPQLLESELFGHEKGAFTGALQRHTGLFEAASGGTFFLDEIAELDRGAQGKLLAVLEDGEVYRVGGNHPIPVDVRVIAATNRGLEREVAAGRFRADLFYRLNVVTLDIPPLRERREDIPDLARHFLAESCRDMGRRIADISPEAMTRLIGYSWPGNIRELANIIERAVIFADDEAPLGPEHIPDGTVKDRAAAKVVETLDEVARCERDKIIRTLTETNGNKRDAARRLGWYPQKLYDRLRRYGIGNQRTKIGDRGDR